MSKTKQKTSKRDPFDNDDWRAHAEHFRTEVLPKIASSAHCMAIVPDDDRFDVKFALEIGAMIMMNKPIVLLVANQRSVPPKLARVADKIIEVDLRTDAGQQAARQRLTEYLKQ